MSENVIFYKGKRYSGINIYSVAPVGSVFAFAGTEIPEECLLCDGRAVSRATYVDLFSVIGTTYGAGDGSTTFNLPDYRETVLVGTGTNDTDTIETHDEYTLGQFKDDQLQDHAHYGTWARRAGAYFEGVGSSQYEMQDNPSVSHEGVYGARTGTTTHGKQKGVNYIIKAMYHAEVAGGSTSIDIDPSETNSIMLTQDGLYSYKTQYTTLPTASSELEGKIAQYTGETTSSLKQGVFYVCVESETAGEYEWKELLFSAEISENETNAITLLDDKMYTRKVQLETLPINKEEYEGMLVQYIGATTANYTNGYFYKCQEVAGSDPKEYEWIQVLTQKDGVPHWSGTRAEYEVVKDTLPVGTYVSFTDDYDEGLEVVDEVEIGNMNPVTSNAVAEVTNKKYMQVPDWANAAITSNIVIPGSETGLVDPNAYYTVPHSAPVSQIFINTLNQTQADSTWHVYINDRRMLQNACGGGDQIDNLIRFAVGPVVVTANDVVKIVNIGDNQQAKIETVVVPLKLVEVTD